MSNDNRIFRASHLIRLESAWQRQSARAASCAGGLAMLFSATLYFLAPGIRPQGFVSAWLGCAVLVALCIAFIQNRFSSGSRTGGELKELLADTLPALLTGAVFTGVIFVYGASLSYIAFMWMIFYGLALLSLRAYAPQSIVRLGWMFLIAGLLVSVAPPTLYLDGNLLMGLSFGGLHLAYAFLARGA